MTWFFFIKYDWRKRNNILVWEEYLHQQLTAVDFLKGLQLGLIFVKIMTNRNLS